MLTRLLLVVQKKEAIEKGFPSIQSLPSHIDLIRYEKSRLQGTVWHTDCSLGFATVIVILENSNVGRLHIAWVDLPEELQAADIIVLDTTGLHNVSMCSRHQNRVVATFVL